MCYFRKIKLLILTLALAGNCLSPAWSSIVINSTRVIYKAENPEVTVTLTNNNKTPVLIQSWLDNGNDSSDPTKAAVPFVITPPINRVDPGKGQSLRISYTGMPALPSDKESLFWLNVLEIPSSKKEMNASEAQSKLNIALRTRIKFFYRPQNLPGTAAQAAENLNWEIVGNSIRVHNASVYHVSLSSFSYLINGLKHEQNGTTISPGSDIVLTLKDNHLSDVKKIKYSAIDDYGRLTAYTAK